MIRYRSTRSTALARPCRERRKAARNGKRPGACRRVCGFTLVELMITLAVAAILTVIAIPSFKRITLSNRLSTTANDLVDAINTARMAAVKRNTFAQFCSDVAANNGGDTLGTACSAAPLPGAVVELEDAATNATLKIQAGTSKLTTPLQVSGTIQAVRFDGQGLGRPVGSTGVMTGVVADICTSQMSSDNHRVISITTGTIVTTATTSGSCP